MTASPEPLAAPAHLHHDDPRAQSILVLAESYNDDTTLSTADRELIVLVIVPDVPPQQVVNAFRLIADDLITATDYDTRGGDAVLDRFGHWSARGGLTADEWASEKRDELRAAARSNAEMLVTLQDSLAARHSSVQVAT